VRWDAGVEVGDAVEAAFDSLAAKLIVHAADRDAALVRMRRALGELEVTGVATVAPFARAVLDEPDFSTDGFAVSTQWIEAELMPRLEPQLRPAPAAGAALRRVPIEIDGRRVVLGLPDALLAAAAGAPTAAAAPVDDTALPSPVPGTVVTWLVEDGAAVTEGQEVVVLDAMKMETRVAAHRSGTLEHVAAQGAGVAVDEPLARVVQR
jgi:acetyl-CoA/propionyl-CoA carboxylase biotin carboxyl carrier protein